MADDLAVTVETEDSSDELTLPAGLVDLFNEQGDPDAEVVADITMVAFTQRAHSVVHHSQGDAGEDLEAVEERALELFEERFGQTFEEATGHSH